MVLGLVMAEYTQWVLWLPVFLGLGVGLYFSLPVEPSFYIGVGGLVLSAILLFLLRRSPYKFAASLAIFAVTLGFAAAQLRTVTVEGHFLEREIGPTRVSGKIVQVEPKKSGARLLLSNVSIAGLEPYEAPRHVRITVRYGKSDANLASPGDWVRLRAVLRPPAAPAAPGAFDFQRYAFFKEIGATGFALGPPDIRQSWQETENIPDFADWLGRARLSIGNRVRSQLPGETGALAAALITAERLAIPEEAVTAMRHAGLAHLLAISGLHIGLVAGLVFFLVRAVLALFPGIAVRYPIKAWAAVVALLAALGYTLLAGATIPTIRSFAMMALVLGAVMIGRRAISMRSVAVAASIILLFHPESLIGPSFQLSFAAVIALVAVYEWLSKRAPMFWKRGRWPRRIGTYLASVALSTLIAGAATAPFAAYHFHHLASFGMLANLIAVPLTALWIMPSALAAMVFMPFGLESISLDVMGTGVDVLLWTAREVADLPGNLRYFAAIPVSALALMAIGGLWICIWRLTWRVAGIPLIATGMVLAFIAPQPLVLVSENGEIFGIQGVGGFYVVGPGVRGNRYTQDAWLEQAGYRDSKSASNTDKLHCDHMGCVVPIPDGREISLLWDEGGLLEDCWRSKVIISSVPVRGNCTTPDIVIDRFDLWRDGAHALYLEGNEILMVSTRQARGERPWTHTPRPRRNTPIDPES